MQNSILFFNLNMFSARSKRRIFFASFYLKMCFEANEWIRSIGGCGFDSHRGQKIFSLPRVVP